MYEVILKVGYTECVFRFDDWKEATDFMALAIKHDCNDEDFSASIKLKNFDDND